MIVMAGWSGEMASGQWSKVDITLDEVDLMRLLVERTGSENGSSDPWGADPDLTQAKTVDVFTALSSEAERLKEATVFQRFESYRTDAVRATIAALTEKRNAALDRIIAATHAPVA
jgi:hypothetical protein